MPELSAVNLIKDVKPGATVLLTGSDKARQEHVVLAHQRYGRGKALAMPVQDVWYWRMAAKVPVSDTTHQMFWRRMIRWLVDCVPDQVNVTTTADRVEPGEPIKVAAEVLDQAYAEVNDATVTAHITTPSGRTTDVPIDWTVTKDGDYRTAFVPDEAGIYTVKVGRGAGRSRFAAGRCQCADSAATRDTLAPRCGRRCSSGLRGGPGARSFRSPTVRRLPDGTR